MKTEKEISLSQILFDQPGLLLDVAGVLATVYVAVTYGVAALAAAFAGTPMTLDLVGVTAAFFMGLWAILGNSPKIPLTAFREWCDDALRAPRFVPTDWVNPSSLMGLAFKGVAEPNEQVVCDAVHAYLGRRLKTRESVSAIGQHEAVLSHETEGSLRQWKFSFNFRNGRDDAGQPFVWITAAHVYAL